MTTHILAQTMQSEPGSSMAGLFGLAILILMIAALWQIFQKAGKKGWKALIPIYSTIVLLQIIRRPWWWILLLLIPIVNIIVSIVMTYRLAVVFGKGVGYTLLLLILPFIGYPVLAWGDATYNKKA